MTNGGFSSSSSVRAAVEVLNGKKIRFYNILGIHLNLDWFQTVTEVIFFKNNKQFIQNKFEAVH